MTYIIREADETTTVLFIHSPYPGRLKFDGEPSSLLYAVTPAVLKLAEEGRGSEIGLLDPRESSAAFYEQLAHVLGAGRVRVVGVSTSSAAIEETARIVGLVRSTCGSSVLVIVGGPHEDDCQTKCAFAISDVDVSVGGEAEQLLAVLLAAFLAQDRTPEAFCRELPDLLAKIDAIGGRGEIACSWWDEPKSRPFDLGPLNVAVLPPRCRSARPVRFSVFDRPRTIPVMISRGCTYGRCTFCAEGLVSSRASVQNEFSWIETLLEENPGAALYFQDSIFPSTRPVSRSLLPLLRRADVPWGCQVYLPMLSRASVQGLADHGCRYLYTGLESGSDDILRAVGKGGLSRAILMERLGWVRDAGMRLGLSVMFGAMDANGGLLETEATVDATVAFCEEILARRIEVAGFYPNVETVLPRTQLARDLAESGVKLDWYRPPCASAFSDLEDGWVGFNFLSLAAPPDENRIALAERIRAASAHVVTLGSAPW